MRPDHDWIGGIADEQAEADETWICGHMRGKGRTPNKIQVSIQSSLLSVYRIPLAT